MENAVFGSVLGGNLIVGCCVDYYKSLKSRYPLFELKIDEIFEIGKNY